MNDPNGLVISGPADNQTIHLYYQYNPEGLVAGNQHWGHATTKSFESYKWENHLPAIAPETGDNVGENAIFSGSAVIDSNNTSGFFNDTTEPENRIVAIYTLYTPDEQNQNVAYSTDGGYNYTKYESNPVLRNLGKYQTQFRDPKVFWDEAHSQWVMAVAHPQEYQVGFYTSPDLKTWNEASRFGPAGVLGYQYECPALFQAPYVGGPQDGETGWVLLISINPGAIQGGSSTQYMFGDWDGKTFTPNDTVARMADFGKDWYAAQTWDNVAEDKKPVVIGWASNWQYTQQVPTSPWRSALSLPREIALKWSGYNPLNNGYLMAMTPFSTNAIAGDELVQNGGSNSSNSSGDDDGNSDSDSSNSTSTSTSVSVSRNQTVSLTGDGAFEIRANLSLTADAFANVTQETRIEFLVHASANGSDSGSSGNSSSSSSSGNNNSNYLVIGYLAGEQGAVYVDRRFAGGSWADSNPFFTDRFSTHVQPLPSGNSDDDDNSNSDDESSDMKFSLHMIVDRSITELFINEGRASAAVLHYWEDEAMPSSLEVKLGDGKVQLESLSVKPLASAWS